MAKGHALNPGYQPGNNWVTCDRCGFERRASDIKTEWNGLEVCSDTCFETRHPQDFLRAKEESITPARVGTQNRTDIISTTVDGKTIGDGFPLIQNYTLAEKSLISLPAAPNTVFVHSDEKNVYIMFGDETIRQYTMQSAGDVASLVDTGNSLDVSPESSTNNGLVLSSTADRLYTVDRTNEFIYQYDFVTAKDLSTCSYSTKSEDISAISNSPIGLELSADDTKLLVADYTDDVVLQFTFSTVGDLDTLSYDSISIDTSSLGDIRAVQFNAAGTKLFGLDGNGDTWYSWDLATHYDVSSPTLSSDSNVFPTTANYNSFCFVNDNLYIIDIIDLHLLKFVPTTNIPPSTFNSETL